MSVRPLSVHPGAARPTGLASIVGFLVVMELSSGILQGWFSPLLPSILERYQTTAANLNWVSAVYLLSTAVCVPLLAKLGDLYGHRKLLLIATSMVAFGSVLVAIAPSFGVLLIGRAIQGALGAFLPLEFAIVRERGGEKAGRGIGLLVGALTLGASLGLLLAGIARQHLSLSVTLWIPAIIMIAAIPVVALLVPETTTRRVGRVDWIGAALLGLGLVALLAAVGNGGRWGWTDARTLGGIIGGLVVLGVWVRVEQRIAHPLVDLSLVLRGGLGLPLVMAFFFGAELFGSQTPTAVFLGTSSHSAGFGLGLSSTPLGAALLVSGVAMFLATTVADRLRERFGANRILLAGSLLAAAGYLLTAATHNDLSVFLGWQFVLGIGNGLLIATLPTIVVHRAPADSVGIASGMYNTTRTVAGAVSGAAFTAVMAGMLVAITGTNGASKHISSEASYTAVWLICAALALVVGVLSFRLRAKAPVAQPEPAPVAANV